MFLFIATEELQRLDFLKSIDVHTGPKHVVQRANIFKDVVELYQIDGIINECPLFVGFEKENAIDEGGVTREMYSAFWEEVYKNFFDGATVLVPFVHPSTVFPILGRILSHGYLASGTLPTRIACPSLLNLVVHLKFLSPLCWMHLWILSVQ